MTLAEPGCLRFQLTRAGSTSTDARSVAEQARWNFEHAVYCLYPCEPSFAYSYCNQFGLVGSPPQRSRVWAPLHAPAILAEFRRRFE